MPVYIPEGEDSVWLCNFLQSILQSQALHNPDYSGAADLIHALLKALCPTLLTLLYAVSNAMGVSSDNEQMRLQMQQVNPEERLTLDSALRWSWLQDANLLRRIETLLFFLFFSLLLFGNDIWAGSNCMYAFAPLEMIQHPTVPMASKGPFTIPFTFFHINRSDLVKAFLGRGCFPSKSHAAVIRKGHANRPLGDRRGGVTALEPSARHWMKHYETKIKKTLPLPRAIPVDAVECSEIAEQLPVEAQHLSPLRIVLWRQQSQQLMGLFDNKFSFDFTFALHVLA